MVGGDGADVLIGGAGSDQSFGGGGSDLFVFGPEGGYDFVDGGTDAKGENEQDAIDLTAHVQKYGENSIKVFQDVVYLYDDRGEEIGEIKFTGIEQIITSVDDDNGKDAEGTGDSLVLDSQGTDDNYGGYRGGHFDDVSDGNQEDKSFAEPDKTLAPQGPDHADGRDEVKDDHIANERDAEIRDNPSDFDDRNAQEAIGKDRADDGHDDRSHDYDEGLDLMRLLSLPQDEDDIPDDHIDEDDSADDEREFFHFL